MAGGGAEGTLTRVDLRTGRVHPAIKVGAHPRGVAVDRHNRHVLVALNGDSAVAYVTVATGKVRRIATDALPYRVALSPDGRRGFVTHNGFRSRAVTPLDLDRRRARKPVELGLRPDRRRLHALRPPRRSSRSWARTRWRWSTAAPGAAAGRSRTSGAPRSVALAGRHAIVADGITGDLHRIRIGANA